MRHFDDIQIQAIFNTYPVPHQQALLTIRQLIFTVAEYTQCVGPITETKKWGQPAYLTEKTKSGTTIRLDCINKSHIGLLVHCQTSLIDSFRSIFPELNYLNDRAIILDPEQALPIEELTVCIKMALTYHLNKKSI